LGRFEAHFQFTESLDVENILPAKATFQRIVYS
jgi:hypothetical protein